MQCISSSGPETPLRRICRRDFTNRRGATSSREPVRFSPASSSARTVGDCSSRSLSAASAVGADRARVIMSSMGGTGQRGGQASWRVPMGIAFFSIAGVASVMLPRPEQGFTKIEEEIPGHFLLKLEARNVTSTDKCARHTPRPQQFHTRDHVCTTGSLKTLEGSFFSLFRPSIVLRNLGNTVHTAHG